MKISNTVLYRCEFSNQEQTPSIRLLYLFWQPVELEGQIERFGFTVVNSVAPGAAAPLATSQRPFWLLYGHVAVRAAVSGKRDEFTNSERVERQL